MQSKLLLHKTQLSATSVVLGLSELMASISLLYTYQYLYLATCAIFALPDAGY